MTSQPEQLDINRRGLLLLGLAGASALVLGTGERLVAGEATGMDIKVIKEAASMIPGFPKVRRGKPPTNLGDGPKTRCKTPWSASVPRAPSK